MQLVANGKFVPVTPGYKRLTHQLTSQTALIMKLTVILILGISLHVSASTYSQSVTLNTKNASLEQVFRQIKKQTGYSFVYRQDWMDVARRVDVNISNMPLEKALELCFIDQPFTFSIVDKTIVLRRAENQAPVIVISVPKTEAPEAIVKGKIVDEKGEPVAGASISVKGTKTGTSTDAQGNFSVNITGKATLLISAVGFESQEIKVNEEKDATLNISLKRLESKMEEVVVTTGIFNRNKNSYTGAVTSVTAEELASFGNRDLITSLRNVDPSFNIIESNTFGSNPNRLPEIQIRGNSSLPNVDQLQDDTRTGINTPLIILDGFESTLQRLLDINQNEVESLTILKDASATAIYGSRGANGVVVIKTKAPKAGKLRLSYRADVNVEAPDLTQYDVLNARQKLDLEYKVGLYNTPRAEQDVPLKQYYYFLLNEVNRGVETDWLSKPVRTGVGQRHNLRLEGGDNAFRYSISAQLNDIQGVMKGSYRRNFNGTINLMYNYRNLRFSNNLIIGLGNSQESPYGSFSDYVKMNPYWAPYDANGNPLKTLGDPRSTIYTSRWNTLPTNPLYNATLNTFDKSNNTDITNNFQVEWRLNPDLNLRARLGVTKTDNGYDAFRPADHTAFANMADILRRGDYVYGSGKGFRYDASLNLNYNRTFGKHSVFGGLDYNIRENSSSFYSFKAEGFSNPNFDFISMAMQYALDGKPSGTESKTRSVGITGSVNYTWDQRYFADFSLRTDGSSQFGRLNSFAPFWSVGAGWNLHQEDFFKQMPFINRLKLRGSTGITGSQNFSAYQALSTYGYYSDDRYFSWTGASMLGLGNENLRWQQKKNYNIGTEVELFNRRLTLVADYYIETTNGLISSVDLPASSGFSSYIENIGRVENRGIELKATVFPYRDLKKGISWSVTGAVVQNRNKIIEISDALKSAQKNLEEDRSALPSNLFREGFSTNTIYVVPSAGIDPSTGKEIYIDRNGDPTYTWDHRDLRAMGTTDPDFFGNVSTMFRYKSFSLNAAFGYRIGAQQYNNTLIQKVENADYKYNVDARVYEDRWQQPGDNAAFKGLLVTAVTNKTSRFVQDEHMFRLQNVNVTYDVKGQMLKKLGMQALSFSGNMADLFYFSTVRQERGTSYPFSRQISFTMNAVF